MAKTKIKRGYGSSSPSSKMLTSAAYGSLHSTNLCAISGKKRQRTRSKRVSWRDEQIRGMSLAVSVGTEGGTSELTDPAILVVKENKFRYGRDELLRLREAPLSQRKPDFLDINEVSPTIWDPTRWNYDRKKSETPIENGPRTGPEMADHRRRPGDPRERLRKENDGIVLSPQRRSFNSGCFVPMRESTRTNRPHSPLGGKSEPNHIGGVREIQTGTRRIGSGRILRDSWDFGDKPEPSDGDFGSGSGGAGSGGGGGGFRNQQRGGGAGGQDAPGGGGGGERRSFGRDFEMTRDKDKDSRPRGGSRFGERRGRGGGDSRDEEPEWFSGGPISQNDTIELRGFDESDKYPGKKKMSPSQAKRARDWFKKKSEAPTVDTVSEEKDSGSSGAVHHHLHQPQPPPDGRSTPIKDGGGGVNKGTALLNAHESSGKDGGSGGDGDKHQQPSSSDKSVNDNHQFFDDIFKADTIPFADLLSNGVGGEGDNSKSRFTQWFSSENRSESSRRSSVQDEAVIKNILKELSEPIVTIPGESDAYFAPISPAANTSQPPIHSNNAKSLNIMQMLQRETNGKPREPQNPARMLNLVELEAKMRQNSEPHKQHAPKTDDDMSAFNRLMAQVTGGHAVTANGPVKAMSLMEMLSHSQQQDEAHARMAQLLGPASPGAASSHLVSDIATRLQQQQSQQQMQKQQVEMLTNLVKAGMHMQLRASPLQEMGLQQSRELLSRPEAQAILQAMHQRIPSPRELQVHTQNILQRALIKKKLEEQQENYRKKQELQQRGQSPNNNNNSQPVKSSVSSPTPLAFTPTSVLRKMTAEKEEGRPIVKANNFQQEQFFNHHQQQQQQQQQQQHQKIFNHLQQQQQRKGLTQQPQQQYHGHGSLTHLNHHQFPNANQQFNTQLTQQQLRAQHQQHARPSSVQQQGQNQQSHHIQGLNYGNQTGTGSWQQFLNPHQSRGNQLGRGGLTDGDLSPTSNQLTRWFSPDLLERARVGELPSTAGLAQHALSLEEIERLTAAPPVHN